MQLFVLEFKLIGLRIVIQISQKMLETVRPQ